MARESKLSIYAALVGNLAIAVVKFIAGYITASSAMLSEAVHSCVDTGNQGLLLLGISKSKKPADFEHPYGHGREIYFWSFVVAVAIFAVGGSLSIYEGLRHIAHPATLEDPFWNYVVLGCASIFESASWLFGWRVFRSVLGSDGPWQAIRKSKDPTTFIVVFEDTGALLGLIIAFAGVFLGHLLNNPYLDATASLVIGLMLGVMSVLLAYETKGLLIGEGFEREILQQLRGLIGRDPAIEHVRRLLTLFFGPEDVMMTVEVKFRDDLSSKQMRSAVARIKSKVEAEYPVIKRIYFAAESVTNDKQRQTVGYEELQPH